MISIISAAEIAIPKSTNTVKKLPIPLFNQECKEAVKARNKTERALKQSRTIENKISYNRHKARCRYIFNNARRNCWRTYMTSINQRTKLSEIWKKVNKISGKFTLSPCSILKINVIVKEKEQVAQALKDTFAATSSDESYTVQFLRYKRREARKPIRNDVNDSLYDEAITESEYKMALNSAKELAPGHDRITYSMLKYLHAAVTKVIIELYNRIFQERSFPTTSKTSVVIPIPKPNKDTSDPKNYRPISLTCCMCKLMGRIVNSRLVWHLEKEEVITNIQSGLRKNRSTTDNLAKLENDIHNAIHNENHTILVYFDLQKAYDSAWRYGLVRD